MTKIILTSILAFSLIGFARLGRAEGNAAAGKSTSDIVAAAKNLLASLDESQRAKLVYDFKDEAQRRRWSNFPTSFVKRGGLRMGDLAEPQRAAVMALLAATLSPQGYAKVTQIVEGDEVLKKTDHGGPGGPGGPGGKNGKRGGPGGGSGGGGAMFGSDEYYVSFLGQPSTSQPWMIQFGGHHLGINITLVGDHATLAPSHTGAQPAIYEFEGKTVRPLGGETDKAITLLNSLDEMQRKQAILGFQMHDLVLGPGRDGKTIEPEGIKGSALNEKQREMLLALAGEWTGIMSGGHAMSKMEEMKKNIGETWFAWSGPAEKGRGYFRIHGPTVFIEYAPQSLGGDETKHIHTIYREPRNDYGAQWIKQ